MEKYCIALAVLTLGACGAAAQNTQFVNNNAPQGQADGTPAELHAAPEGYKLVWSDEFDTNSLTSKWIPQDWDAGRVNHELQTYKPGSLPIKAADGTTMHTAEVKDGILTINCFKGEDGKIYSARMDSRDSLGKFADHGAWRYGYMEARIKIPKGTGTWPAFWMMPTGVAWREEGWPTCGEIDIMEEVGADPDIIVSSLHADGHVHSRNTQVSGTLHTPGAENGWVTYAMLWDEDNISMYADGRRVVTYANDHGGIRNWPYDRPYFITLNLAWGGDWGGYKGVDESVLPVKMDVDYVRVYQYTPQATMEADGSGTVYVHGPYNGVGRDSYVLTSTFNTWADNYFAIKDSDKTYSKEFKVGQNLHPTRGQFKFYTTATPDESKAFTPGGTTYRATLAPNDILEMDSEGVLSVKPGLAEGDIVLVTLDCSRGTDKAEIRVSKK